MIEYDPISLRKPLAELERWAAEMIFWFKPELLPLPVISIQGGHRDAYGWFAWSRWEHRDGHILDEINFVPEYLGRDVFDIAECLVHELVHLANYTAGIKDCSANQYHNSKFRDRALAVGLKCERVHRHGWAKTELTPALRGRIELLRPDAGAFDLFRLPPPPRREPAIRADAEEQGSGGPPVAVLTAAPKRKKLSKWICGTDCAPAWVATGRELQAECLACGSAYHRAETSDLQG